MCDDRFRGVVLCDDRFRGFAFQESWSGMKRATELTATHELLLPLPPVLLRLHRQGPVTRPDMLSLMDFDG